MCAFPQGCLLPVRCFSLFCSFPSRRRLQPLMQWEGDAAVCQVTCPPGIPAAKECGGGTLGIGWSCDPPWTPDPRPQIWPPAFVQPLRPRLFPGRGGVGSAISLLRVRVLVWHRRISRGLLVPNRPVFVFRIHHSQKMEQLPLADGHFQKGCVLVLKTRTLHDDRQDDGEDGGQNAGRRRHPGK